MRKLAIYYFLFLFFLLSFFASGVIDSQDGFQYLGVARKLYYTGEPTAPSPKDYLTGKNIHLSTEIAPNGKSYSPTGLGYTLAMIPAVAITDIFYKIYHVIPTSYFPLQSDWMILLLASFTNCFFGAILGVIFFLYFTLLGLNKKQSIFISLVALFATNLFVYTKHSFAHMMFITFMTSAFLLLKYFSLTNKRIFLFFSGLCLGGMMISYNQTYIFSVFPYIAYYLLLTKFRFSFDDIKKRLSHPFFVLAGILPFWRLLWWFNYVRFGQQASVNPATFISGASADLLPNLTAGVLMEGLYGLLLSPGRSIFLYTPLLLLPFIFWHKIPKKILPEFVSYILMMIIYVVIFGSSYKVGRSEGQGIEALWHGEYSWGPRYMLTMIPLGMLVVAFLFKKLTRRAKLLVFLPLAAIGLYVEILGVVMPYQVKFQDLDPGFQLNNIYYRSSVYINLLPRHSPILTMSKKLIKLAKNLPKTLNHGPYNVRFYDGIDFPFNVGGLDRWRVIDQKGNISFDNPSQDPVTKIAFNFINHPLDETASSSAHVNFILNNKKLFEEDQAISLTERKFLDLPSLKNTLKNNENKISIIVRFDNNDEVVKKHNQFLAMMSMFINGKEVNKESIDVPYLSDFGTSMAGITYENWGGMNKNPWIGWNIHTQIFERVPDFWWVKAWYYWDFPKKAFFYAFLLNILFILFFGYKTYKNVSTIRRNKNVK